jgi:hypothetical protein
MKKIPIENRDNGNDRWLREHFEEIVNKYAGRYIVIADNKILYTDADGTPRQIVEKCRAAYPKVTPFFFRVPRPEDFVSILVCRL